MNKIGLFKQLILKYKKGIGLTYALFGLEILGSIVNPFLLGKAIDGLIAGSTTDLITFATVYCLWIAISVIRKRMDTIVYTNIYTTLVTRFLKRNHNAADVSKLSARSTLAQEFVNFFEYDLGYVISSASNLIGAVVMLYFYSFHVFLACIVIMVPVILISAFFGKRIKRLNKEYNDEYEKQIDVIAEGDGIKVNTHYKQMRKWQIKLSNQEAFSFGLLEVFNIILIVASLLIIKGTSETIITTGLIIGVYNYILKFSSSLESIPHLLQRLTNLNDILDRINISKEDLLD